MENSSKRFRAVYAVVPKQDGKDVWLRIGTSYENRDGSETVLLDAVPIGGRLQIRDYQPRDQAGQRNGEEARSA